MQPSLAKQDIGQLRKDIPKYDAAGVLSTKAKEQWTTFLQNVEIQYGKIPDYDPEWILDSIAPFTVRCKVSESKEIVINERVLKHLQNFNRQRKVGTVCVEVIANNYVL